MALRDRIKDDIDRVFMNPDHFAEMHTLGDTEVLCIIDSEEELKRKNNNVSDISFDSNTDTIMVFIKAEECLRAMGGHEPRANMTVYFDRRERRLLKVEEDGGMYGLLLSTRTTAEVYA